MSNLKFEEKQKYTIIIAELLGLGADVTENKITSEVAKKVDDF